MKELIQIIRCPSCRGSLAEKSTTLVCQDCAACYPRSSNQVDLRLTHPKKVRIPVELGRPRPHPPLQPIPINPISDKAHKVPFNGLTYGNGLTPALYSWFPLLAPDTTMLDLGCGNRRFEEACQVTGAAYIGLDIDGDAPDVLGYGEALPFADESFDFVLAIAVLPHAQHPTLVVQEISRVLRPGSLFIGTAQFLEPCYMASRHHVSALGLIDWLDDAGLEILHLEPNRDWDGLMAINRMGYLPDAIHSLFKPIQKLHQWLWLIRPSKRRLVDGKIPYGEDDPAAFTGGFRFIARKPIR